jgi:uncharacterized protein (TIGR02217 family)
MPAPVVDAIVFPTDISRGAQFGPTFSTIVIETVSGAETRVAQWLVARHRGTVSMEMRTPAQFAAIKSFFLARTGRARGFLFQDWSDFQVMGEPLIPQPAINPAVGSPTIQLIKTYTDGLINYVRNIYKPAAAPVVVLLKNSGAFGGYSLDTTTGIVTLTALNSKAITGISAVSATVVSHAPQPALAVQINAHSGSTGRVMLSGATRIAGVIGLPWRLLARGGEVVFTRSSSAASAALPGALVTVGAAHGFVTGDLVYFTGVVGMPLSGLVGTVTATGATTIIVSLATALTGIYLSGGTATKYLTATDTLTWTGNFYIPVRLDTDELQGVQEDVAILNWSQISIVEMLN